MRPDLAVHARAVVAEAKRADAGPLRRPAGADAIAGAVRVQAVQLARVEVHESRGAVRVVDHGDRVPARAVEVDETRCGSRRLRGEHGGDGERECEAAEEQVRRRSTSSASTQYTQPVP